MTRMSKQAKRRAVSPRRPKISGKKTGSLKCNLENGYRPAVNALEGEWKNYGFFAKQS